MERAFGERASVGWIGRSTTLIVIYGTFGSLAVFVKSTWVVAEAHPFDAAIADCIELCPTGLSDGRLDARKCISYWTIEHRGLIHGCRSWLGDGFSAAMCAKTCAHGIPVHPPTPTFGNRIMIALARAARLDTNPIRCWKSDSLGAL